MDEDQALLRRLSERIRLLIHILRELRESHQITAEKLHEAALDVRRQITPPERWLILDEIHRIRLMEEKYQRGEIRKSIYSSQTRITTHLLPFLSWRHRDPCHSSSPGRTRLWN